MPTLLVLIFTEFKMLIFIAAKLNWFTVYPNSDLVCLCDRDLPLVS